MQVISFIFVGGISGVEGMLIGLKRSSKGNDDWHWTNGDKFESGRGWSDGEPNNSGGDEDCVVMKLSDFRYNDIPCDHEGPRTLICQYSAGKKLRFWERKSIFSTHMFPN